MCRLRHIATSLVRDTLPICQMQTRTARITLYLIQKISAGKSQEIEGRCLAGRMPACWNRRRGLLNLTVFLKIGSSLIVQGHQFKSPPLRWVFELVPRDSKPTAWLAGNRTGARPVRRYSPHAAPGSRAKCNAF